MRDKITYPFPNLDSATVEVWEWTGNFIPHFIMNTDGSYLPGLIQDLQPTNERRRYFHWLGASLESATLTLVKGVTQSLWHRNHWGRSLLVHITHTCVLLMGIIITFVISCASDATLDHCSLDNGRISFLG